MTQVDVEAIKRVIREADEARKECVTEAGADYDNIIRPALLALLPAESPGIAQVGDDAAKIIYDAFPFDGKHPSGSKPEWVPGGNAIMQDKARKSAQAVAALLRTKAAPATQQADAGAIRRAVLEEAAALCDARAISWQKTTHASGDEPSRSRALGLWTGFESAAKHIRALKSAPPGKGG
jgi:hypothetical protein